MRRYIAVAIFLFLLIILSVNVYAANIPMEIIQPQPSLTTANRYYKAYPGLEYNVKVGVLGGTFPFVYSLTTYPSGMTINADTGVITWPNPTVSGSPHNVTMSVKDSENTTVTRSWTITVTTSGFRFLDAVNGNDGNSGTLASPWKTMGAFYLNSKNDSTYAGEFLYFRNGTYYTITANVVLEDGWRVVFSPTAKPIVWMGYPGETPTIDINGASIAVYPGDPSYTNVYFDNFNITNNNMGIRIENANSGIVVRRINFSNMSSDGSHNNWSGLMLSSGGPQTYTTNVLVSENTATDMSEMFFFLAYHTDKVVAEYNTMRTSPAATASPTSQTEETGLYGITPQ